MANGTELAGRRSRSERFGTVGRPALAVLGVALVVAAWAVASTWTQPLILPSPSLVWQTFRDSLSSVGALNYVTYGSGGLVKHLTYTVWNVLVSVGIGAALGILWGLVIGRIRMVREISQPVIIILGAVPVLVLLPFLSLWFGASRIATGGMVVFYTLVTLTIAVQQAALNVAGQYEQYATTLGAGNARVMREVVAPAVMPETIGALRVALAFGWGFQAIAEVLGGQIGAGRVVDAFAVSSNTAGIFAVIIALAVIAVIADAILVLIGNWLCRWAE